MHNWIWYITGPMLKLKLQYFGHLMWRTDSLEKTWCWERVKAGGEGENRGWGGWMAPPTQCTWIWASSRSWWWTGRPGVLQSLGLQRVGHDWVTELHDLTSKHSRPLGPAGPIVLPSIGMSTWVINSEESDHCGRHMWSRMSASLEQRWGGRHFRFGEGILEVRE